MKTGAIQQQASVLPESNVKLLKNGSSVLVRVISNKGNGRYEGSVAGVRISFSAKNPLSVGQSFVATVNQNKGILELIPKLQRQQSSLLNLVSDGQISKYLSDLGLVPDNLSFHLLKQLKQNKMEFNESVLNRVHKRAMQFSGKEKNASEILLMLYQKGINLSDEELNHLLNSFENVEPDELISKLNKIKKSWLILPFNIVDKNEDEFGKGYVKILQDEGRNVLKTVVNCIYLKNTYSFLVDFQSNLPFLINMHISNVSNENAIKTNCHKLEAIFRNINPAIKVLWCNEDELKGFGCELEKMYVLGGEI